MTEKLSVCVINRNGGDALVNTLASIMEQGDIVAEVLLVDNASDDGSPEKALACHPSVKLVRREDNCGPGAARNAGFRAAQYERILFVDGDVRLQPGCAAQLRHALAHSERIVAAMPRVRFEDTGEVQCDGADSHYLGFMLVQHQRGNEMRRIGSIVSACMLLDRSRWGRSDPFDEDFFIYYEDHDFGLRARAAGWELVGVPAAVCSHGGGTPGLSYRPGRSYPTGRVYFHIRNRWQLILKNYEFGSLCLLAPCLLFYEALQLAGVVSKGWFKEWTRAAEWVLSNRRTLLAKRRAASAARTVSDRELWVGGELPFHPGLLTRRGERAALRFVNAVLAAYWRLCSRIL